MPQLRNVALDGQEQKLQMMGTRPDGINYGETPRRRPGFQQEERFDGLTGCTQLLSHLVSHHASEAGAAQTIGAARLQAANFGEIGGRHRLDAVERLFPFVYPARLESVQRLVRPEVARQFAVAYDVPADPWHEEQRRL